MKRGRQKTYGETAGLERLKRPEALLDLRRTLVVMGDELPVDIASVKIDRELLDKATYYVTLGERVQGIARVLSGNAEVTTESISEVRHHLEDILESGEIAVAAMTTGYRVTNPHRTTPVARFCYPHELGSAALKDTLQEQYDFYIGLAGDPEEDSQLTQSFLGAITADQKVIGALVTDMQSWAVKTPEQLTELLNAIWDSATPLIYRGRAIRREFLRREQETTWDAKGRYISTERVEQSSDDSDTSRGDSELKACYAALGLTSTATVTEVRNAFRMIAKKLHPDVNLDADATARMTDANNAYTTILRSSK